MVWTYARIFWLTTVTSRTEMTGLTLNQSCHPTEYRLLVTVVQHMLYLLSIVTFHNTIMLHQQRFFWCISSHASNSKKKRGNLFAYTQLKDFCCGWRQSDAYLKWVIYPGYLNYMNKELIIYILAMYNASICSTLVSKMRGYGSVSILPTYVNNYILSQSKTYPQVLCVLIKMSYAEVISMLKKCETSNYDLFVSAIKFVAPLFATTHAKKYVSMTAVF